MKQRKSSNREDFLTELQLKVEMSPLVYGNCRIPQSARVIRARRGESHPGLIFKKEQWAALLADEEHGGWLVPIFALAHEHDPDPEMRPYKEAIGGEEREKLIVGAAAGVTRIYRYFEAQRLLEKQPLDHATTFRRTVPKIGRNDPCPCGSGKKFKQCCGRTTLH
jgi:uncharacterized protein